LIGAKKEKEAAEKKIRSEKPGGHSVFMDFYAMGARWHMKLYGTSQRQLAAIAAKAHNNSTLNPLAQYTFLMTVEQVMEDREVAYPLTRAMCAPIGDGSAAAILCSEHFLKKQPSKRAVSIRASVMKSGSRQGQPDISERTANAAYELRLWPRASSLIEKETDEHRTSNEYILSILRKISRSDSMIRHSIFVVQPDYQNGQFNH